jgi:sugar phosphate isomerase/epimerase
MTAARGLSIAVISDEISSDLAPALRVCEDLGIEHVELRVVDGRQLVEHDAASVREVAATLRAGGFRCPVVDTPFLKDPVPQTAWDVLERGLEAAVELDAGLVRVFSGLRADDPAAVRPWIVDALAEAAGRASAAGIQLALEIEHVCNVATAAEAREVLDGLEPGSVRLVWDPGNEVRFTGRPATLPAVAGLAGGEIAHVHVKDASPAGQWTLLEDGIAGWSQQVEALAAAGYGGFLSVETHIAGPEGGPEAATRETVRRLRVLVDGVAAMRP